MNNTAFLSIAQLRKKLDAGEFSKKELLDFFIKRFAQYDDQLGSALEIFESSSFEDDLKHKGALADIPGLIKDIIAIKNRRLSCGSKVLEGFTSPYDATAIERLRAQGALFIGRGNMDEFAMGSSTETSAYKKSKNPWNVLCVPGGSSGGSAAAVAAGFVPWALGTDTGGSVRQPAAFCGIVGLRPTYGRISRFGMVAYGSSLDQIGIFSRTVADNALLLSIMAGKDERDSTTIADQVDDYAQKLQPTLSQKITIGVVEEAIYADGMHEDVKKALEQALKTLEGLGCTLKTITLPALDYTAAAYFIISRAEAASNLARFDGVRYGPRDFKAHTLAQMYTNTRTAGFGEEVKKRIVMGNYVLSAGHSGEFYANAQKVRQEIAQEFRDAFTNVDLIFMPTHPAPAFKIGAFDTDKLQMDLQDYFTCPINLAGVPALSVPCGFSADNMPIGMQLIGPHAGEQLLFQVAHCYEQATDWHLKHPPMFL